MATPPKGPDQPQDDGLSTFNEISQVQHDGRTYSVQARFRGRRTDALPQRINDFFPRFIASIGADETTEKVELTPQRARLTDYASFHHDLGDEQHTEVLTQMRAFGAEGAELIEASIEGEPPQGDMRTISGWLEGRSDNLEATLREFRAMPAGVIANLNEADIEVRVGRRDLSFYFDSMQGDLNRLVWHVGSIKGLAPFLLSRHAKDRANLSQDIDEAMYYVGLEMHRTLTERYRTTALSHRVQPLQLNEDQMRHLLAAVGRGQGRDAIWGALGFDPAPAFNYSITTINGRRCRIDIEHIMGRHTAIHFATNEFLNATVAKTSFWPIQFNAGDVYRLLYHALENSFIQEQGAVIGQQPFNTFIPFTLALAEGTFMARICFQRPEPGYDVRVASFFPTEGPGTFEVQQAVTNSIAQGYNRMISAKRAVPDYS